MKKIFVTTLAALSLAATASPAAASSHWMDVDGFSWGGFYSVFGLLLPAVQKIRD